MPGHISETGPTGPYGHIGLVSGVGRSHYTGPARARVGSGDVPSVLPVCSFFLKFCKIQETPKTTQDAEGQGRSGKSRAVHCPDRPSVTGLWHAFCYRNSHTMPPSPASFIPDRYDRPDRVALARLFPPCKARTTLV